MSKFIPMSEVALAVAVVKACGNDLRPVDGGQVENTRAYIYFAPDKGKRNGFVLFQEKVSWLEFDRDTYTTVETLEEFIITELKTAIDNLK